MYTSKVFSRRRRAPITAPEPPTLSPAQMESRAGEAAALLKALANPARLMLICHLVEGERSVGELGDLARIDQPSLSQQLGVLRDQGLVATRRAGKHIHYRIASDAALALLRALHSIYCAPPRH